MAEGLKLTDKVSRSALLVDPTLVEVGSQVDEACVRVVKQVPNHDEDRACDSDEGSLMAPSAHEPAIALAQERVGSGGRGGGLAESSL